jgi:hypothetical protein
MRMVFTVSVPCCSFTFPIRFLAVSSWFLPILVAFSSMQFNEQERGHCSTGRRAGGQQREICKADRAHDLSFSFLHRRWVRFLQIGG